MSQLNHLIIRHVMPSAFTQDLTVGDVITHINGKPASDFYAHPHKTYDHYQYSIQTASGQQLNIDSPVPIAVKMQPSAEFLLKAIKDGDHDWKYFEYLWESDDWDSLRVALTSIKSHPAITWLFEKVLRRQICTAENLFRGALAYHDGDAAEAKQLIEHFMEHAMDGYTTNFHAIAYFYLAQLETDPENADYLRSVTDDYNNSNSDKINQYLSNHDIAPSSSDEWLDTRFPTDLTLENLYRPNITSLQNIIHAGKKSLTPICVMPAYRANGPYHDVMQTYLQMWPYFKDHINPLIVLADTDGYDIAEHWLGGERKVIAANIPLTVMMDTDNLASDALGLSGSPTLFVIDTDGTIIQEGLSDPMDYWNLLAK